jgi:Galactose oxidase, central domain
MVFGGTRTTLFGGEVVTGQISSAVKDTWEWSGKFWTQRQDIGPAERVGHAMAYDANRDRVVLFGGLQDPGGQGDSFLNDTWELPGNRITLTGLFTFPAPLISDGTGTIRLSNPAPIGGLNVSLSSTGPIRIPGSVNIAEGKTIEVFPLKAGDFDPTQATTAIVTAKLGGSSLSSSVHIGSL